MGAGRIWPARLGLALCAVLLLGSHGMAGRAEGASTVYITTLGDSNVEDLFRNTLIPDFQRAFPRYRVSYTNILHGLLAQTLIASRLTPAQQAGKGTVDFDVIEDSPVHYPFPAGKSVGDYFLRLGPAEIPNMALMGPEMRESGGGYGVAYRASAVTLAYDSRRVPAPPRTFAALIAWIRAHPGKFTYCPPDQGGSGGFFVASALRSVMDEQLLRKPYDKAYERDWPKAWALLRSIEPDLFQRGFHPAGNVAVLNLLGKGAIWMAPVWSDQGLSAQAKGLLPKAIAFTQIAPPFAGGPSWFSVPRQAQNPAGARAFINFVLRPQEQAKVALAIEGFPAIDFKYLPASLRRHFGPIAAAYGYWPGGQYDADLLAGWRANVPIGE